VDEPTRSRSKDTQRLGGGGARRSAADEVRPGRSVFDDDAYDDLDLDEDDDLDLDDGYDDDDDLYDDDEDTGAEPALPHWTAPPSGQSAAVGRDDVDSWTTLTGSQPRWRSTAEDYDDDDDFAFAAEDAEGYDAEVASEDFFEFEDDDENDGAFGAYFDDAAAVDDDDAEGDAVVAPIPVGRSRAGAAAASASGRTTGGARAASGVRPGRTGGADMPVRVVTGVAMAVVAIAAFAAGRAPTVALVAVVLGLAAVELTNALRRAGYEPATLLTIVATAAMPVAVYAKGVDGALVVLMLATVFSLLWFLARAGEESPVLNAGVTVFGVAYVGLLGSYAALMLKVFGVHGIGMLLACVIGTAAHDIGGLVIGRAMGHQRLTSVSPGKTKEGLVGGMVAALVAVVVLVGFFEITPFGAVPDSDVRGLVSGGLGQAFVLGLVIAITAPLGDLAESLLKRDLGVKDMGNLLKGHGGVLDRFDAFLFTLPATYYVARLILV
jgi:phosphatidate cytidylyltransferase